MQWPKLDSYGSARFSDPRGRSIPSACLAVAVVLALQGGSVSAGIVVWDGGALGTGNNWETGTNWDVNTKPQSEDTAQFVTVGTATISLGGVNQTVQKIHYSTATAFTIGNANTLTVTDLERQDVAGDEGIHTISSPVTLGGNATWSIAGASYLNVSGAVAGTGLSLTKNGAGELRLAGNNTYDGGTVVNQGVLRVTSAGNSVLKNVLTVGNGTDSAEVILAPASGTPSLIANTAITNVNANAKLTLNAVTGGYYLETLNVNGGTLDLGGGTVNLSNHASTLQAQGFTMTGGTLQNGTLNLTGPGPTLTTHFFTTAAATTANFNGTLNIAGYQVQMDIADGSPAIDLNLAGPITGSIHFRKLGAGTMALSNETGSTVVRTSATSIAAGKLLANNESGSAVGNTPVTVDGGATLGGTGRIGGVLSNATNASNVSVTATGTVGNLAMLAPGSVDAAGVSTIESLAVGDATQNNNVTFGNYSSLLVQLGNPGSGDRLDVFGNLNLNSGLNTDSLQISTLAGTSPSGVYTLATFTGTLTGRFDGVTLNGSALPVDVVLEYRNSLGQAVAGTGTITNGSIVVTVPEPAIAGVAAIALMGLSRRRRSSGR